MKSVTTPDWVSCANNQHCENRDAVIARWSKRVSLVPDMAWTFNEVLATGDSIIVRGEGTGTPTGEFLGLPATGRGFRVMAIDIHKLHQGRVVRTHHVEDWLGAARQLRGE